MTHRSSFQSRNFTLNYYQRLVLGGGWLGSISAEVQSWRHTISAFGGFDTAEFSLVDTSTVLDDWVANGLGRGIIVYDETLVPIWEGFVNSITVQKGGLTVTHGPVLGIANKVKAIYSGVDTSVYPPVIGVRKQTAYVSDTESQEKWGIWPEIVSLAGVTNANADQLVDMYLNEHHYPDKNSQFSFATGDSSINVSCLGWVHTLHHPYNYTALSGTIDISTRIQEIITAQLNPWISTDYSRITTNTTPTPRYVNDDRLALETIRGLTAMGDSSNNRYFFGIYENRQAIYEPVSSRIDYQIALTDPKQIIVDSNKAIVAPWRIRPGRWVFFNDFMSGLGQPDVAYHEDPRMLQIESVQFDMRVPFEVQLEGGKNSKYEQKSAKLGLRGTAV